MKYIVDIDGTICSQTASDYENAQPFHDRIAKINALHDEGHTIIYWTARGMASNKDHSALTKRQLKDWGCKYHEVMFGKPQYDVWVDDKAKWLF